MAVESLILVSIVLLAPELKPPARILTGLVAGSWAAIFILAGLLKEIIEWAY